MRLGDLAPDAFAAQLAGPGIAIRSGPFVSRIVSRVREIAAPGRLLYAEFPVVGDSLADYNVRLHRAAGLSRRLRSHIVFSLDGESAFHPFPRRLALPLLEWGLNWCVYKNAHQYFMIHAAVVQKGSETCLLPGTSGAGKSTLCAALVSRGWRLLSDELAVFRLDDGHILPIARPISLKNQSIALLGSFAPDQTFGPVFGDTRKGSLSYMKPPDDSVRRMDEPSLPTRIIFPAFRAGAAATLDSVSKGQAFFRIADCALNYHILGRDGFDTLAACIDACECYEFRYASLDDAVRVFDRLS